jgi:CubicO group peptidase (beta-lactamase class C family)
MRRRSGRILKFLGLLLCVAILVLIWESLPFISAYGAKVVCSGVFVAGRDKEKVKREDLASFPISLASCVVNEKDSSVTASVCGVAKRKAIYRRGLGATLVTGLTEEAIRRQRVDVVEAPAVDRDTVDWPMGDRGAVGIDTVRMKEAVGLAFGQGEASTGTRAVIVVHKGKIVAERYAPGFDRHTRLAGWSMTKGVTNALIGLLVGQGKLDIEKPAPVEEWKKDDRRSIRLADLLHMNSGLSWWELYAGPGDATKMLFGEANMGDYAERSALRHLPGEVFNYSSGTANILSAIVRSKIGAGYYRWPYEQLFYKIGMYSAVLEPDAGGTFVGSSYCYATGRDWARFGLLYLWDGVWGGRRVLPEGWVDYTRRGTGYGALWWLNRGAGEGGSGDKAGSEGGSGVKAGSEDKVMDGGRRYPGVPEDCFSCEGYEGQYIWVIPSKDLVVVRLAMEHGRRMKAAAFLRTVIGALPKY